jgi:hypothetical protein
MSTTTSRTAAAANIITPTDIYVVAQRLSLLAASNDLQLDHPGRPDALPSKIRCVLVRHM